MEFATDASPAINPWEEQPASNDASDWAEWARAANSNQRWRLALERWERCIQKFGDDPHWIAQKGHALWRLDRIQEAETVFEALNRSHPTLSVGLDGLAWTALRKGDSARALSLFTRCIEEYRDQAPPAWRRMRASLLLGQGRSIEAEALYRQLVQANPGNRADKSAWVRAAIENCRTADDCGDRRALSKYVFEQIVENGSGVDRCVALHLLRGMGAWDDAARLLLHMVRHAHTLKELEVCFQFMPQHVERGSCGPLWSRLLTRVSRIAPSREALDVQLRLLLALENFPEFIAKFESNRAELEESPRFFQFERVRNRIGKPRSEVFAEAKVFGIGLFRTGTTSLSAALNVLGIDSAHWINPLTGQLIDAIDIFMFGASTDSSVSQNFEKLYYQYPNARFVLTTRPLDSWVSSISDHQGRHAWARDIEGLRNVFDQPNSVHLFRHAAVEFGLYLNSGGFPQAYRAFDQRVRHFFSNKPEGKLLELDLFAGGGWPELCRFLDRPIPDVPFPKLNAAAS